MVANKLYQFYKSAITSAEDYQKFLTRTKRGKLTREENPISHCCSMLLIYDPHTQKILVVLHKKASSWIFPGGHIEQNELPVETAIREAFEEIGLKINTRQLLGPFAAQILYMNNPPYVCREHYDIFFAIASSPSSVTINMTEFTNYAWLTIEQANQRITMKYYRSALEKFVKFVDW